MKHTFILICVILCSLQTMATNLVLERRSNAEVLQDIAIIGQWVFVGNTIQLLDKSGNILATEPIANIKKIQFATHGTNADVNDTVVHTIIVYKILYFCLTYRIFYVTIYLLLKITKEKDL